MNKARPCLLLVLLLPACVTIPPSSVKLSGDVGRGIEKQFEVQRKLVDLYFAEKRRELDEDMLKSLDTYFETIAPDGSVTLTVKELTDVAVDVKNLNRKNNAAKRALDKTRVMLIQKLGSETRVYSQANASITGLLQSSVKLKNEQSDVFSDVAKLSGGKMNIDGVLDKVDRFVQRAGPKAGRTERFIDSVSKLLGRHDNQE